MPWWGMIDVVWGVIGGLLFYKRRCAESLNVGIHLSSAPDHVDDVRSVAEGAGAYDAVIGAGKHEGTCDSYYDENDDDDSGSDWMHT